MPKLNADSNTGGDRLRTHPKERLAPPVQRVALAEAAQRLRAEAHAGVSGHRQLTLVRRGPVSIILFIFEQGAALKEHKTEGEVTIHVLSGHLRVTTGDDVHSLRAGEFISLAPGETHAVQAVEETEMLLSICRTPLEP